MISEEQRVRARHHLGYGGVQQASTFYLGVPAGVQTAFMIEGAWARILPSHEGRFEKLLQKLDKIEEQWEDDQEDYAAEKVGDITVNLNEFDMLLRQYKHWQGAIANMLQVPPNPFDQRPGLGVGYNGGNGRSIPVG